MKTHINFPFQNKSKYDQGPAPTLKAQPAAPKPAPTLTPAFTDASPTEKKKPAPEPKPAQAPSTDGEPTTPKRQIQYHNQCFFK